VLRSATLLQLDRRGIAALEAGAEAGFWPGAAGMLRLDVGLRLTLARHLFLGLHPISPTLLLPTHGASGITVSVPMTVELGAIL
jgi:hypothetical protein